ncbi:acetyl-CoA synthetase-like protein [Daedalea quercina L-15889]|uniref:Acetyl-CoA synthetase-like protein n=1 Tax=Daedalea quercina L-15889 TaxID=1314783 RepID=A0A165TR62_9APHY|nr:acetyl-CoA synthetase-like protein [Daedalea quercina L-15889]
MPFKSPFPEVPPLPDQNVHDLFFNSARLPEKDYVLHVDGLTGEKRTRSEFVERVRVGASALCQPQPEGPGVGGEGEIVGILSHNSLDYITLIHSLLALTTPFALLSAHGTAYELAYAIRTSKATCLFVGPDLYTVALEAAREVGLAEERIFVLSGRVKGKKSMANLIDSALERRTPVLPVRPAKKDTLAYLVFSSGTTGLPKAVMVTHGNIAFAYLQSSITYQASGLPVPEYPPVGLAFLPFYHTYGLHMICMRGFSLPVTFVVIPNWDADLVLRLVPKYRINILYMIPSALHQLVHHKKLRPEDFATVASILCGAAHLPPLLAELFRKAIKAGPEFAFAEGFGMSEVTISASRQPTPTMFNGRIPPALGSVGLLQPGMEGMIVREDGTEAGVSEQGELWLRGGNVVPGYWGNEEATRKTFSDGWLKTGDQFKVDALGRLYFVERAKDTLKVSGLQVAPSEIEALLMAHPERLVVDACVAGVSGGRTSDEKVPRAWVVLSETGRMRGRREVIQKLDEWTRKNLSKYKWLRGGIDAVDEIPKSPTGKVLRRALQDHHENEKRKPHARL